MWSRLRQPQVSAVSNSNQNLFILCNRPVKAGRFFMLSEVTFARRFARFFICTIPCIYNRGTDTSFARFQYLHEPDKCHLYAIALEPDSKPHIFR
jgi:hypothetical protein